MNFTKFELSGQNSDKDKVLIRATYIVAIMPLFSPIGMNIANGVLKFDKSFKRNDENQITYQVSGYSYDEFYQKCLDIRKKWLKAKAKVEEHINMHKALVV